MTDIAELLKAACDVVAGGRAAECADWRKRLAPYVGDPLVSDVERGEAVTLIARRLHATLAAVRS
jgi:hypothetical protein